MKGTQTYITFAISTVNQCFGRTRGYPNKNPFPKHSWVDNCSFSKVGYVSSFPRGYSRFYLIILFYELPFLDTPPRTNMEGEKEAHLNTITLGFQPFVFGEVPSRKLTWQWKITIFQYRKYIFRGVHFPASYVSLPECKCWCLPSLKITASLHLKMFFFQYDVISSAMLDYQRSHMFFSIWNPRGKIQGIHLSHRENAGTLWDGEPPSCLTPSNKYPLII